MLLIRDDEPIPFDHSVERIHSVPAFDIATARLECSTEVISVDSLSDAGIPFVGSVLTLCWLFMQSAKTDEARARAIEVAKEMMR